MVKKEKPKNKEITIVCSGLTIEEGLIFCPQYKMPMRIEAKACKTCNWNDGKTEKKLFKEFIKGMKK